MLHYLINFLYPPRCAACEMRLPPESARRVCTDCLTRIAPLRAPLCDVCGIPLQPELANVNEWCPPCTASPPHFSRARALTTYSSLDDETQFVSSMIRRHKYGLDQSLGHALAECLSDRIPFAGEDFDVIIPVPLHLARLRWRGFNQAALLAQAVAQRLDRPILATSLLRVVGTPPQTSQDHRQRRRSVHAAFAVKRPLLVANRRILLVDDVMTTGATADECSRMLLRAGARRVDVFTLARVV
jgi:ComF family protein